MKALQSLILTHSDIASIASMELAVTAVEHAFRAHGQGTSRMPVKVYLPLEEHDGDFRAMPAYLDGIAGVKWINSHPHNPTRHGLPSVMGVYILSDPATAVPLAILDATLLTALRTGAAAAIASQYLANKTPRTLGFIGCGVQSRVLLNAHHILYKGLQILAFDRESKAAAQFAQEAGGVVASLEQVCACDILCTSTPSRTPVVQREWVKPGAHINAMGADAPGKQELEAKLLQDGRVFVDDFEQASESGEINVPLHQGSFRREQLAGTLGQVVAGKAQGRTSPEQITIFDSTGLAVQDAALAKAIYQIAKEKGIGQQVALINSLILPRRACAPSRNKRCSQPSTPSEALTPNPSPVKGEGSFVLGIPLYSRRREGQGVREPDQVSSRLLVPLQNTWRLRSSSGGTNGYPPGST